MNEMTLSQSNDQDSNPPVVTIESSMKPTGETETGDKLTRRRLEKIQQHLAATLDSADTLQACMGPVCCDLLEMAQDLKSALDQSLASVRSPREKSEKIWPAIKMYLKVVQQAERMAKLDIRINEAKQASLAVETTK